MFHAGLLAGPPGRAAPDAYEQLWGRVLVRDNWRCQKCGSPRNLQVHHKKPRSQSGNDSEFNLITLCSESSPGAFVTLGEQGLTTSRN
jgi:hypothetical protein